MRRNSLTIAALVVVSIASGAATPAFAQDVRARGPADPSAQMTSPHGGEGRQMRRAFGRHDGAQMHHRGRGAMLTLTCAETGVDRLEHALLSIRQRTNPTDDQQALFDDFQSTAIAAQADFAAACLAARPAAGEPAAADLIERLQTGLDVQQAHLDAMNTIIPVFGAFYESLDEEQQASLAPSRPDGASSERRMGRPGRHGG